MGWLEDLAKEQGYDSLRALAVAVRGSDQWPGADKRSAETVANKLRQADKGQDIAWWMGVGKPLLRPLAATLQDDEEALIEQLQRAGTTHAEGATLWPFKVFPALRPLDLRTEEPFPGIPDELLRAGGPKSARTWWVAPTGAGKTLVGERLKARYDWTFLRAERWADIQLPAGGPVFVELGSTAEAPAEVFAGIPPAVKICIAAPNLPSGKMRHLAALTHIPGVPNDPDAGIPVGPVAPDGFEVVTPPPPKTWVLPLLDWAAARVTRPGGFDAKRVREMVGDEALLSGFATPGELLGFLGMVDHVGVDWLRDSQRQTKDPLWWIRVWLKAALERPDRRPPAGTVDLLGRSGPEILVDMEVERLRRGLAPSLSESEWIDLVPRKEAPEVDRDRLLEVVNKGGSDALEQVRAMLSPDGASLVMGLKAAGALAGTDADHLRLWPAWVANAIDRAAFKRLYVDAPEGLGSLLLFSGTSAEALLVLIDEVRQGQTGHVEACVATAPSSPERMASLEGAFRAVGLALALGAKVPLGLIRATWERQMAHRFLRHTEWPPIPVLSVAAQSSTGHGVTSIGAWFAAAFAMSRTLVDARIDVGSSALNPWGGLPADPNEREQCARAMEAAAIAFRTYNPGGGADPFRLALFRLGADLLDRHGIIHRPVGPLDIQSPDVLVELAAGIKIEISEEERQQLLHLSFGLTALEEACGRRNVELEKVLGWCWTTWGESNAMWPPAAWLPTEGNRVSEDAARLWKAAPAAALSDDLCNIIGIKNVVWPWLTGDVWARWLEFWSTRQAHWIVGPFRFIPEALALQAVRDGQIGPTGHQVRKVLWERMPQALIGLIDELSAVPPGPPHPKFPDHAGPIVDLLYSAPPDHCPTLVERARAWSAAPSKYPGVGPWLWRWLGYVVEQRAPGWRDAYELFQGDRNSTSE